MATEPTSVLQVGDYKITREMGRNREGGRITYLAQPNNSPTPVVLKQFRFVQTDSSWRGFKSYEQEIAILESINHPKIPRYLDSFETEDGFCMVQEYKNAPTLADTNHLSPDQIQTVAIHLLQILVDLQAKTPPIIHRDIKPENILIDPNLDVFLIDFGLAKLNHESIAVSSIAAGTPGFIPPEEMFNRPLGTSADLYGIGATIIALLTGKNSFAISELIDENFRFQFQEHLPTINSRFIQWLSAMVEPNPKDRFANAKDALNALTEIDINDLSSRHQANSYSEEHPPKKQTLGLVLAIGVVSLVWGKPFLNSLSSTAPSKPVSNLSVSRQWFETHKAKCNALEVITNIQNNPYPKNAEGIGYGASCYALAGKLSLAKEALDQAPASQQLYAANILFQIGHPVADRGDDESAGPIMDLVLEYWPQNYMARYHAGMSAYVLGNTDQAKKHLHLFLTQYRRQDGWTAKAKLALSNIDQNIPADERFKFHH